MGNDEIIGDYLDALLSTPMPVKVIRNRFELQRTIKLDDILSGQRTPSQQEAVLILLTTLRLSRQLRDNARVKSSLLQVASQLVVYLRRSNAA
ncbi:hypothetical protein A3742_05955 [Oleiphilus sp. HI0071]|uniref:hypothetical protein n=1 Tax=unclassified Oleiphilus TaxID=2631174 RepID=UPI0007C27555|nr:MULTISPECIES: hypothetical protein [unclassified Oleiphilus]KZY62743.1 hypothetical protein A3737_19865 [Oleiphilus sp. HI0065]KZY83948.1 hypothetical protein A3742_05955 [Oleiphilus sp. HI0071]KZY91112.1 hypothetical protein A3744_04395 [Oleiphilus sp. HI0073]KZZ42135.1 hypothetical protein A3758_06045 [Oleiphilus sp. HI0118]KZZ60094.1 hypothetical protein A3760_26910 [Oleiphilus sp. HI0122]KZZ71260.1 hypothetical protein A3765_14645 [Oleiphilus sp. HI0130]KZZ77329.1 hypothetical protein